MAKAKQPKTVGPEKAGLIYSKRKQAIGVLLDGVVFYSDGSSELGLGHVFPVGDAIAMLKKMTVYAERHAAGEQRLISVHEFAAKKGIDFASLDKWAHTALAYLFGVRIVKIGITQVAYLPEKLNEFMLLEEEWLNIDETLEKKITDFVAKYPRQTAAQIALMIDEPVQKVTLRLNLMNKEGKVTYYHRRYRLSPKA